MSAADRAAQVVAAARALVGVPFRLHGRDRDGLDCVGLAALALGRKPPFSLEMFRLDRPALLRA